MDKRIKHLHKTFTLQQDQADCGVACLLSIIKFYEGNTHLEKLRELSGTTRQGTTMLGLYQCAHKLGFAAEGCETDFDTLKTLTSPCILYVTLEENRQHYVVYYGLHQSGLFVNAGTKFLIGDPATGIVELTETELDKIWQSKILLTLQPTLHFAKAKTIRKDQKIWFLNLLKDDFPILIISIFLGIVISVLSLSTAIFSQKLIDTILPKHQGQKLAIGLVLLFLLLIVKTGLGYLRQHFLLLQSRDFNTRIGSNFYEDLLRLPKSFFDHRKTGDMIARMNDTMRVQKSIAYITGSFFIDFLVLIISTIFLFVYSWQIAVIALLSIPFMALIVAKFHQPIMQGQQQVMAAYAKNESNYVDTIQGIATIKEANKEAFFTQLTKNLYSFFQQKDFYLGKTGNKFGIVTEILATVLMVGIIAIAALMVLKKQLSIGEMIAIMGISGGLIPAVARLALTNLQIQEAKIALNRMYEFVSVKPEYVHNFGTDLLDNTLLFQSLAVKEIAFRFPGRKLILENVTLNVSKGEIIALLGESGCGKSTTLQILQKFYEADSGEILVNNCPWDKIPIPQWRNIIATVPQEIKIFNGTLLYNITLDDKIVAINDFHQFCSDYGFDKYFLELPQAYLTLIGEDGINLSGGQKQLVGIARALYKKPQLLLLDEATSAMDINTEKFILHTLQTLKPNMAIILITHKPQTAKIADRIYIIENGITKYCGNPNQLLQSENLFSTSLLTQ
jgi:ATP-binding cassette, subfamily C, bacteriocin exporter